MVQAFSVLSMILNIIKNEQIWYSNVSINRYDLFICLCDRWCDNCFIQFFILTQICLFLQFWHFLLQSWQFHVFSSNDDSIRKKWFYIKKINQTYRIKFFHLKPLFRINRIQKIFSIEINWNWIFLDDEWIIDKW